MSGPGEPDPGDRSGNVRGRRLREKGPAPLSVWRAGPDLDGGAKGTRTPDPHTASVVRYQLRHSPVRCSEEEDFLAADEI